MKRILILALLFTATTLFAQKETVETQPDGSTLVTLANGSQMEEMADGTTWAIIHPFGEFTKFKVDFDLMPTDSHFSTIIIRNLPDSGNDDWSPKSERIYVDGDCHSWEFKGIAVVPYYGKEGTGIAAVSKADIPFDPPAQKVLAHTSMEAVFDLVCKK